MTPKLCLCCICGNEARYARRFFAAFRPHVDAMVVVRACGSAPPDDTLDVAREFGCITGEYTNAPANQDWAHVDDFAAARNLSFSLAPPDCEWLLWADFDDEASPESLAALRAHAASDRADWYFCAYEMPTGQTTWRERLVRRGTAHWIFRIHEHLAALDNSPANVAKTVRDFGLPDPDTETAKDMAQPVSTSPQPKRLRVGDVTWVHAPTEYKESSHRRNVAILTRYAREHSHYVYYLHVDHFLHLDASQSLEDRLNAIAYGIRYLEMPDRAPVFEYGVLLNLMQVAVTFQTAEDYGWRAFRLMPWLREAVIVLCKQALDLKQPVKARSLARLFSSIPKPIGDLCPYFLRPEWYGWAGVDLYAQVARYCGDEETARKNENALLDRGGRKISLLHATRGRPEKAFHTRNLWLHRASTPEQVEHIFAIDADDAASLEHLKQFRRVTVEPGGGCVAAWNAAAAESCCEVLVQLSDDWMPPIGWDEMILERIGDTSQPAVLAISDGHRADQLLCMAILTRARYLAQREVVTGDQRLVTGSAPQSPIPHHQSQHAAAACYLFHPDYIGVFSDNEFTDRAYADGVVIEARDIVFEHQNPLLTAAPGQPPDATKWDRTYAEQNAPERYTAGRAVYERRKQLFAHAHAHSQSPA